AGQIPFTPQAKKALELSLREALSLGHNYIGTEHILLGLVRESESVAARILLDFDADAEKIRNRVVTALPGSGRKPSQVPWARARPLPKWRYRVEQVPPGGLDEEALNRLGDEGWELVAIVESQAVFKRRHAA